jgi:hypothetical protein
VAYVNGGGNEARAPAIAGAPLMRAARVLLARGRVDQVVQLAEQLEHTRMLARSARPKRHGAQRAPALLVVTLGHSSPSAT